MHRLPVTVFSLVAPTTAGVGVVVALVSGVGSGSGLILSAGAGVIAAVPLTYLALRGLR